MRLYKDEDEEASEQPTQAEMTLECSVEQYNQMFRLTQLRVLEGLDEWRASNIAISQLGETLSFVSEARIETHNWPKLA